VRFSIRRSQGQVGPTQKEVNDKKTYQWQVIDLDSIFRLPLPIEVFDYKYDLLFQLGIQNHDLPILVPAENQTYKWEKGKLTAISMGGGLNIFLSPLSKIECTLRYQNPLSRSANLPRNQKFIFDGFLIWSYKFTSQFFADVAWYGQWANFKDEQTLFQSSVGLGIGYLF
jgi:hypothetical protein